jgi:NAD-dependent dihydropyrimidine dehydrogenase PreA subunit
MAGLRYLSNVVTLALDDQKCTGCGMCAITCPHAVFAIENDKARIVGRDACIECGACARNCPADALSVDAGVGCATAILIGALTGAEPNCDCSEGPKCCG